MRRREFLHAGVLTWAGLALSARAETEREARVVSTWRFGVAANRRAYRILKQGRSPLDAVERGVMLVEADPEVQSVGIGGLPNSEGVVELDASIMDGATLEAGSVAGLQRIKHPIAVARKVMDETRHVMLVGDGARRFAVEQGFKEEDLLTPASRKRWEEFRTDSSGSATVSHDTIGMVAMDPAGGMAAACTTSGLAWKLAGRVGDSPLVGHGMYCDGAAGGAAATGIGEEVIKVCGSYQVVEFMRQGLEPDEAIRRVLGRILRRDPGNRERMVGFVAMRADGEIGYGSTTPGFQAAVSRAGKHELFDAPSMVAKTG